MRSPTWFKIALVMSAYLPLFVILELKIIPFDKLTIFWESLLKDYSYIISTPQNVILTFSTIMLIASIVSCYIVASEIIETYRSRAGAMQFTLIKITTREQDVLTYISTYILPLVSLNVSTWNEITVTILLILLMLWLSLRSDLLFVNPLIFALGFYLYSAETPQGNVLLISKKERLSVTRPTTRTCYRFEGGTILLDSYREGDNE